MRTKRSALTFVAGRAFTVVTMLAAMVATPLLLRWLGTERYGAFEALSNWFSYIVLLELGITEALAPLLVHALGRDSQEVRQILASGIRSYFKADLLVLLVGLALTPFIGFLIPVGPSKVTDLQIAWLIALVGTFAALPSFAFTTLAEAEQRGYWAAALLLVQALVITGASLAFAWLGYGIAGQSAGLVIGTLAYALTITITGSRRVPGVWSRVVRKPENEEIQVAIRRLRGPSVVFNVCGRLSLLSDNILVAFMMSPAAVVPFYLTQRLASMAQREMQGIGNATWAGMGEIFAQNETQLFRSRLVELTRLVAIVGVAGLVPISVYNRCFITLWVGADHYGGHLLTAIASLNALLLAEFSLWMWCVTSIGSMPRLVVPYAVQTAINFVLSVIFTAKFGLIGPVLGTLVGLLSVSVWFLPRLLSDLFGIRPRELLGAVGAPVLLGLPYLIGAASMASSYGRPGWFPMAWQMSLCASTYLGSAWLILLDGSERSLWLGRLRLVFVHRAPQTAAQ